MSILIPLNSQENFKCFKILAKYEGSQNNVD